MAGTGSDLSKDVLMDFNWQLRSWRPRVCLMQKLDESWHIKFLIITQLVHSCRIHLERILINTRVDEGCGGSHFGEAALLHSRAGTLKNKHCCATDRSSGEGEIWTRNAIFDFWCVC